MNWLSVIDMVIDNKEIVDLYKEAEKDKKDHIEAMCDLIECCGKIIKTNEKEAIYWYKKAVDMGSTDAMCKLAFCYKYGRGVRQSFEEAVYLYKRAAKSNCVEAIYELACYYFQEEVHGRGKDRRVVRKSNPEIAFELFRKAAKMGSIDAMHKLAYCYTHGAGVTRNIRMAKENLRKAAALMDM